MRILITGGGTGGHLAIAEAVARECRKRKFDTIYVGSQQGQDRTWFAHTTLFDATYFLPSSGVVNKRGIKKFIALKNIALLALQAKKIIQQHRIDAVLSVGGYSAAPAAIAALLTKTPLFIHEQNAVMGKLNTLLAPFAKRIFCSFLPPYDPYPVRSQFFATQRIRSKVSTVLFLGGSQGAQQINDLAMQLAPTLHEHKIAIIHQTGKRDYDRVHQFYTKHAIPATYFAFSNELANFFAQADLAISRAGASTLWELAANALPAIYLPYPYAANNHQYHNATFFVQRNCGWLYDSFQQILAILHQDLSIYSKNLATLARPDGTQYIVDTLLQAIK